MKSEELVRRLRAKFAQPKWAFIEQVANGLGPQRWRTLDGVAIATQGALGYELWGFEVKVSRGDWIKERDNPYKSKNHQEYCDRFYLVVSEKDIVRAGELPIGWGLLVPYGKGLRVAVEASLATTTKPISKGFLAALMRRVAIEDEDLLATQQALAAAYQRGFRAGASLYERQRRREYELLSALDWWEAGLGTTDEKDERVVRVRAAIKAVRRGMEFVENRLKEDEKGEGGRG